MIIYSSGAVRYSQTTRKLITPDEIRRIPKDELIIFRSGSQPLRLNKLDFNDFVIHELMKMDYRRRAPHPMHVGEDAPISPNHSRKPMSKDAENISKPHF